MGEPEEPESTVVSEAGVSSPPPPPPDPLQLSDDLPVAALTLDEAKIRRRREKMRNFRKYLVDTHVVDALAKLLIGIFEAGERPERPQDFFVDYFGEYRDPVLDEIDELSKRKEELISFNRELSDEQEELSAQIVLVTQERLHQKLWKAISRDAESVTSLQVYQRLCEKKKPKGALKGHTFNKAQFLRFLAGGMTEEWRSGVLAALYPQGDKNGFLASAPFKADPENSLVNAFVEANNAYDRKTTEVS
ncbi:hypothetical protein BESB_061400 [Besnoitia besnoiti]|uniref:Uncharacterized protein n=1 Tax=Besnoitia besnoiti TaxID=94643 RepID=A0A2A9MHX7_BESBE|nr:hypothetical protein BESB_061400 [Besnoitia besnoiti]PFH35253.1 hypothetical protein BESB_061400 [Besnoitia besnoiti]